MEFKIKVGVLDKKELNYLLERSKSKLLKHILNGGTKDTAKFTKVFLDNHYDEVEHESTQWCNCSNFPFQKCDECILKISKL
jgi:hypothetical protein